jgi:hypothetical protein
MKPRTRTITLATAAVVHINDLVVTTTNIANGFNDKAAVIPADTNAAVQTQQLCRPK